MPCKSCGQKKSSCGCGKKEPTLSCKSCGKISNKCRCPSTKSWSCNSCGRSSSECGCSSTCGGCSRSWDLCSCESSSDTCYVVKKCSSSCGEIECHTPCPSCPPYTIACQKSSAVVVIQSQIILTTGAAPFDPTVGVLGQQTILQSGNGFFTSIKCKGKKCKSKDRCNNKKCCKSKRYIICPASLVLIPPTYLSANNRYPFVSATQPAPTGLIPSTRTQVSRISVTVFNVNNKSRSYVYTASLVGVDGAGDIAVLSLNSSTTSPKVKECHPYFDFADSCKAVEGETVYLIGSPWDDPVLSNTSVTQPVVVEGLLQDAHHTNHNGFPQPESIVVSALVSSNARGMAIVNGKGCILGMQTAGLSFVTPRLTPVQLVTTLNEAIGEGIVGGISEFFMREVLKSLINVSCCSTDDHIVIVPDAIGSFRAYVKGYAGLAYEVVDSTSWTTQIVNGLSQLTINPDGSLPPLPNYPEIVGIKITAIAGGGTASLNPLTPNPYVPGATGQAPIFTPVAPNDIVDSPFLGILAPGDIVYASKRKLLGDLDCQYTPSLFTWPKIAGDSFQISYRKASENYANPYEASVSLATFPALMDFPWYAINKYPLIAVPAGQLVNPLLPASITYPITLGFKAAF